jgi:hypothetical protein
MTRISCWTLVLLTGLAVAKDKNKDKGVVPDYVLHARTVQVLISPDASTSLNQPMANTRALEDVSRALEAWGRFTIVTEGEPDLLIAVRAGTGQLIAPSIERGPVDNRVGTTRPGGGNVGIGAQQGRVPADSDPMGPPVHTGPHIGNEIGRANDSFEVYRGGLARPFETTPLWSYTAKDAVKAPNVTAVEQFRKAIATAEKKQKKP